VDDTWAAGRVAFLQDCLPEGPHNAALYLWSCPLSPKNILCSCALAASGLFAGSAAVAAREGCPPPVEGKDLVQVCVSVFIARRSEEVFDYAANVENDPQWRKDVSSMRHVEPVKQGVGLRSVEKISVWGKQFETITEVTEFEAGKRAVRKTVSGMVPVNTLRAVEDVKGGSRFIYSLRGDVSGVTTFRLLRPVLQWYYQRKLEGYAVELKQLLEASKGA
jgi:hypothetical protein